MNTPFLQIIVLLASSVSLAVAVWVLVKKRQSTMHRAFFLFVSGGAVWSGGIAFLFITHDFLWSRVVLSGGVLVALGFFSFSKVFPEGRTLAASHFFHTVPLGVLFVASLAAPRLFVEDIAVVSAGNIEPVNGLLFSLYMVTVGAYIVASVFSLAATYRRISGVARARMQYFLLGIGVFIFVSFISDALLPALGVFKLNFLGPLSFVVFVGMVSYAIMRHQLMDVRVVVRRGVFYTLVLCVIWGAYAGLAALLGIAFHGAARTTAVVSAGVAALLGAAGVPLIERSLRRMTDKRTAELERAWREQKRAMIDISHELQIPLTVMRGRLELLRRRMPAIREVDDFEQSVDEISRFISDLLKLARLESEREESNFRPVDMSALLEGLIEYFDVLAREEEIELVGDVEKGIFVSGTREKVEEVAINLVSNAMKYMKQEGERKVEIHLFRKRSAACLTVRDTGKGMRKKDILHIFERFYRVRGPRGKQSARYAQRGSGLGLAITKHIVEQLGGEIDAKSKVGKGTTMTVTLPITCPSPHHKVQGVKQTRE